MKPEWEIAALCRNHLEALPGIRKVTLRTPVSSTHLPTADISVVLDTDVGQVKYIGEVMRRLTAPKLDHWLLLNLSQQRRRPAKSKLILLADYVSPAHAQRLIETGIDYVDAAGNLLIHKPGRLYLLKSGARPTQLADQRPGRLFMSSGLQVLFVLLIEPGAASMPYRQLAWQSGVALGSVAIIMNELKRKGYLSRRQDGWSLTRRDELLELWVSGYSEQLRPKLVLGLFYAPEKDVADTLERLRTAFRNRQLDYALTGGFAAYELTHHYQGEKLTVFVPELPPNILQQLRWLPSPKGPITVLRQFCPAIVWSKEDERRHSLTHPLLAYAELLYQGGERQRETARIIYDQYLAKLAAADVD